MTGRQDAETLLFGGLLACFALLARSPAADAAKFFIAFCFIPSFRSNPVLSLRAGWAKGCHLSRPISSAGSRTALMGLVRAACASEAGAGADATSDGMPSFP
ncbi:hypothetical protein LZ32DRAFT_604617 [Colletotrichum eremochloae]|nr:hypothetical protein LZ32DRAFT_604617 [Colletotrichum eremochloae]